MGCEAWSVPTGTLCAFLPFPCPLPPPLSLLPLWGCSVGVTLNTSPQSKGVQGWELVLLSSPGSDAELPPAGPGPACPSAVETFPVGMPGPQPGCKEPFAGYLPSIISLVLGRSTGTNRAAATTAMLLGWGWDWGCCPGARMAPWLPWLRLHMDLFPRLGLGCQWVPMPPLPMARSLLGTALLPHACY